MSNEILCRFCKKQQIYSGPQFLKQEDGTWICAECYTTFILTNRSNPEEFINQHTCTKCGKVEQSVFVFENEIFCRECFVEKIECGSCGKHAEDFYQIGTKFRDFAGKYYCIECIKPVIETAVETIIITTTNNFDGYRTTDYFGIDSVEIVIGTGWFSEFTGELTDFLGLRSTEFEKKLQRAKDTALFLLRKKAYEKGANAIVGADIDYTEFSNNRVGLILNGTLVKIER